MAKRRGGEREFVSMIGRKEPADGRSDTGRTVRTTSEENQCAGP